MKTEANTTVLRKDFTPVAWLVPKVDLIADLVPDLTTVTCTQQLRRNSPKVLGGRTVDSDLVFNGDPDLSLISIELNGVALSKDLYEVSTHKLAIRSAAFTELDSFTVKTVTSSNPSKNSALNGLYLSGGNFFTQCEAEGFRRITWFQDRPDVMSEYHVELRANQASFPVLLSNGNLVSKGQLADGRHFAKWHDPYLKPCYLFAMVAGTLEVNEKTITRPDGSEALLQVWVKPGNLDRTHHALQSLEASINWDRQRFGLELDLDRFMIVAVDDFNMGAMENKGLNIFNSAYVFASPELATDTDYDNIEAIVGHEYFHNWTGNRVTCRDWFQLTLKEGLTVFRDQEFSSDMAAASCQTEAEAQSARAVNRIKDVTTLRRVQFVEDAGPMAHPIRPEAYQDIDNFYTATVYEKGAEVIRMMQTLLGRDGFKKGMDLYFERHDGQAVTCDDFIAAMADANQFNLNQFTRWYHQAHTPKIEFSWEHLGNTLALHCKQIITPSQEPFHIPILVGIVDSSVDAHGQNNQLFELTETQQTFMVHGASARSLPSIARNFSAPIVVKVDWTVEQLRLLASYDGDPFNRWDALQQLATKSLLDQYYGNESAQQSIGALVQSLKQSLLDPKLSPAFKAELLNLPQEPLLAESITSFDPVRLRAARLTVLITLAHELEKHWPMLYQSNQVTGVYRPTPSDSGKRALRNSALGLWAMQGSADQTITDQYHSATNMTDRLGALNASRMAGAKTKDAVFAAFAQSYRDEVLAMDKWYLAQATSIRLAGGPSVLSQVKMIYTSNSFDRKNPNRLRSLVGAFFTGNLAEFHGGEAEGYAFWAETIGEIDSFNPQIAARLARSLDRWNNYGEPYRGLMQATLTQLAEKSNLSVSTREIISKALKVEHA